MPEYAPPNNNISVDNILLPKDDIDGLAIIYRKVKTMVLEKTQELILMGLTDEEVEHELRLGKIILPTGDAVGVLAVIDILGPIFEPPE